MTQTNPTVAALAAAEQQLAQSINAASQALDGIGTAALADALARFELAANNAQTRMHEAVGAFHRVMGGLYAATQALAANLAAAVQVPAEATAPVTSQSHAAPAPAEQPAPAASEEIDKEVQPLDLPTAPAPSPAPEAEQAEKHDDAPEAPAPAFPTTLPLPAQPAPEVAGPDAGTAPAERPEVSTAAMPPARKARGRKKN